MRHYLSLTLVLLSLVLVASCATSAPPASAPAATQPAAQAAAAAPTQPAAAAGANPLRIGMVAPLSGSLAQLGQETVLGSQIAVDLINESGGVKGQKVQLVSADTPTPDQAKTEVERLITREGLKIILGNYGSSLAIASSTTAARNGAFYWEQSSSSYQIVKDAMPNTVKSTWGNFELAKNVVDVTQNVIAKQLNADPKGLKIALMAEDSAWGSELTDYLTREAKTAGLNLVTAEAYNAAKTTDFTPLILRLKDAKPDVLVAASYIGDATLFQQQAKKQDLYVKAMIGLTAGYGLSALSDNLGKAANGILVIDSNIDLNQDGLTPEARQLSQEFNKRFAAKAGHPPASHALYALIGTYTLLKNALPSAKSLDPADITAAATALDLPFGTLPMGFGLKFTPKDSVRPQYNERGLVLLNQWQDGKLVPIYPDKFATGKLKSLPLPQWSDR